jgi:hypothetical protein
MFEFPNAESGQEERFGSGQGSGGSHGVFAVAVAVGAIAWAARFFASFGLTYGARSGVGDVEMSAVHNYSYYYYLP